MDNLSPELGKSFFLEMWISFSTVLVGFIAGP
jgi:hypothetical protein